MKRLLLATIVVISSVSLFAQSQTGTTTFNKAPQPSVIYNLPYSAEAVTNGVENKMSAYGKPKKVKDFVVYKNILVPEISKEPINLYFNAEKKSNKDNDNAILTMMISSEHDRFYGIEDNRELFTNAKSYLDNFEGAVAAANLELIRNRASGNLGPTRTILPVIPFINQAQMRTAIKNERRYELAMEGKRFYDLVRWGDAVSTLGGLGYTHRARYYPIPQQAINLSGGILKQNPEW